MSMNVSNHGLEEFRRQAKHWLEIERKANEARKEFYGKSFTIEEGKDGLMVVVDDPYQRLMWEET